MPPVGGQPENGKDRNALESDSQKEFPWAKALPFPVWQTLDTKADSGLQSDRRL